MGEWTAWDRAHGMLTMITVLFSEKGVQKKYLDYKINELYVKKKKEREKNEFTNAAENKHVKYYIVSGFWPKKQKTKKT